MLKNLEVKGYAVYNIALKWFRSMNMNANIQISKIG